METKDDKKFAKNFEKNLINNFDDQRLEEAKEFITAYLQLNRLDGLSFLDAGCGSGVFTLAALELGATVTSFDLDELAISNVKKLLQKFNRSQNDVELKTGSVLDADFLKSVGFFDIVLCWGVAHHCGDMWKCLDLISKNVKPQGLLHLGIYNYADGWGFYPDGRFGNSSFWNRIKKFYASLPHFLQTTFDYVCMVGISFIYILTLKNPFKELKSNERRGMTWQSDLKDWLIGYPYEYAKPEEVFDFMKQRGFVLIKMKTNNGLLTNNFVFKKV